ncbi:MAG: peptidoglycan/LPS O-acetylase OafA/YrhL [Sediminicola sp.]|jgi:peptidoglycan/LPS O-acetylase OafA/YrhL
MKYIPALDGIRALAIILVMLFHFQYMVEVGWVGVQLFFVLSGFLITSILLKSKESKLGFYLKRFYWRRSLRIFPLYYAYLLVFALTYAFFSLPKGFSEIAPYLFLYGYNYFPLINGLEFDSVFTHFWSLSVEEQFYLFWPFVIYFISKQNLKYVLIVIIVLNPLFRALVWYFLAFKSVHPMEELGEIIYRLTFSQLDAFAIGALIPVFDLQSKKFQPSKVLSYGLGLFFLIGMINLYTIGLKGSVSLSSIGFPIGSTENYAHIWSYTVINFASLFLIYYIIHTNNKSWLNRVFGSKVLIAIGKVSYGMYVYHWVIMFIYNRFIGKHIPFDFLSFMLYFMICYMISWVSFRYFEVLFLKIKEMKFKKRESIGS